MEKEKTIYCGSGKKMNNNWLTVSLHVDKIKEHIFEYNGKKYCKLNINIKEIPDQYDKDVSLSINTYKPEPKAEAKSASDASDDLPF